MKSLQLRLAVALTFSLLCAVSVLWWQTKLSIRQLAEDTVAEHLEHDAGAVLAAIDFGPQNRIELNNRVLEPVFLAPDSGQYYWVAAGGETVKSPSLGDHVLSVPKLAEGEKRRLYQQGPRRQPLLIMAFGYQKHGRTLTLAIADDLSPTFALIGQIQQRFTLIAAALLVFLVLVQIAILRVSFRSLRRVQAQLGALERGERKHIDTDVPSEVAALVGEFNRLLHVLEQRLQRSRHALADLAHALKTPLTVLQQLPRQEALREHPELQSVLAGQTANMQRLMERVLKRARMAGSGPVAAKFDSRHEMPALLHVLKSLYREKDLTLQFSAPSDGLLAVDREDMLELAGNLLDNACKWAKSTVTIRLEAYPVIRLIIEDDGPGVDAAAIADLAQRGARLDETMAGHGLGLAIAKSIVAQYGGHLTLGRSQALGGFYAEAVLSAAEHA